MKRIKHQLLFALLLLFITLGASAFAQITPSQDSYTNTAKATTNYGTSTTLGVLGSNSSIQTTYIQFDLSSIPAGYTSAQVAKATLKLYVNSVTTAGSFNVDYVSGSWSEKTVTSSLAPALGNSIASSVPLTTANANDYVLIDVTPALGEWLNGSQPNDGIALVANSGLSATFDSKENTTQSHSPELDIVFATGLPNSCAANQILQWNGSAWVCATEDPGTITGVTAGADLTGGGNSGNITLNLDTTKVPQLYAPNTFFGTQTVNGDLNASGTLYGNIASVTDAAVDATSISGVASATTGEGWGVYGETDSSSNFAVGVFGWSPATSGSGAGVYGWAASSGGVGTTGQIGSPSQVRNGFLSEGVGVGLWGDTGFAVPSAFGVIGTADDARAGFFENNSASWSTLVAVNDSANGFPFYAIHGSNGCDVDAGGNLNCTGAKHAVVPIDGGHRKVALSAIESPMNWFEDVGSGQLANGVAVVQLDSDFTQTVNTEREYQVFLTAYGDCKGLYVTNRTAKSFEVHELGGGTAGVSFGYRIMALRKNFENIRMEDHTNDPDPAKMLLGRQKQAEGRTTPTAMPNKRMPVVHSMAKKTK